MYPSLFLNVSFLMSGVNCFLLSSLVNYRLVADLMNALRSRVVPNWRTACVICFAGQNLVRFALYFNFSYDVSQEFHCRFFA